jgi:hypothetical protein
VGSERNEARTLAGSAMDRADKLLRQMTIEEKAMQLSALYPMGLLGADGPIKSQLDAQVGQGIGHICGLGTFGHKTPRDDRQDGQRHSALPGHRDPAQDPGDLP